MAYSGVEVSCAFSFFFLSSSSKCSIPAKHTQIIIRSIIHRIQIVQSRNSFVPRDAAIFYGISLNFMITPCNVVYLSVIDLKRGVFHKKLP